MRVVPRYTELVDLATYSLLHNRDNITIVNYMIHPYTLGAEADTGS
jgi:hypothetical protein